MIYQKIGQVVGGLLFAFMLVLVSAGFVPVYASARRAATPVQFIGTNSGSILKNWKTVNGVPADATNAASTTVTIFVGARWVFSNDSSTRVCVQASPNSGSVLAPGIFPVCGTYSVKGTTVTFIMQQYGRVQVLINGTLNLSNKVAVFTYWRQTGMSTTVGGGYTQITVSSTTLQQQWQ